MINSKTLRNEACCVITAKAQLGASREKAIQASIVPVEPNLLSVCFRFRLAARHSPTCKVLTSKPCKSMASQLSMFQTVSSFYQRRNWIDLFSKCHYRLGHQFLQAKYLENITLVLNKSKGPDSCFYTNWYIESYN